MAGPRPPASLTSALLARKGEARPAMRRQRAINFDLATPADDLGWNDMGDQDASPEPAVAPAGTDAVTGVASADALPGAEPSVVVTLPSRTGRGKAGKAQAPTTSDAPVAKVAFTLRLDRDRHARLRAAAGAHGTSAQALVTAMLDRFLPAQNNPSAPAQTSQPRSDNEVRS